MFLALMLMFAFGGTICILLPILMPGMFMWEVFMGLIIMGLMMMWIGMIVYAGRSIGTGANSLNNLAKPGEALSIHERRGGQGKLRRAKLMPLEHIRIGKEMIFKDTGGGTRIAGHRIIKTNETTNHNVPDRIVDYLHKVKIKYMVDDLEKLNTLANKLKALKKPIPGILSLEEELKAIPELNVIMQDTELKQKLLNMELKDIQQMSEILYDGTIMHYEDYEKFQEAAAPYDLESYTKRRDVQRIMEMIHFRDVNAPDWMKYAIILFILLIGAGLAFQMIK